MIRPVAIVMGSKTDYKVLRQAEKVLKEFRVPFQVQVVSAHRTPQEMLRFAEGAADRYSLVIAGAGGAAHLPGMIASVTTLPVIGVPVTVGSLKGIDALLSIAQMPAGIPVASMAVDGATNAGLLAVRILSLTNPKLRASLERHQRKLKAKVKAMNRRISKKRSF